MKFCIFYPCLCVRFLGVLWFPPISLIHASKFTGYTKFPQSVHELWILVDTPVRVRVSQHLMPIAFGTETKAVSLVKQGYRAMSSAQYACRVMTTAEQAFRPFMSSGGYGGRMFSSAEQACRVMSSAKQGIYSKRCHQWGRVGGKMMSLPESGVEADWRQEPLLARPPRVLWLRHHCWGCPTGLWLHLGFEGFPIGLWFDRGLRGQLGSRGHPLGFWCGYSKLYEPIHDLVQTYLNLSFWALMHQSNSAAFIFWSTILSGIVGRCMLTIMLNFNHILPLASVSNSF